MSEYSELVKRLRGGECPQCRGFGEVAYFGELVRCACQGKYEALISMDHRKAAADALEAQAKEIERLVHRLRAMKEDDGRQIVVDALASLLVKTAHMERDRAWAEVARLKAEIQDAAEEARKEWIENGQYNPDGIGT